MDTTSFYAPPEVLRGDYVVLPEDEAHHASRVLRVRPGDEIVVVDGEGGWYRVRLDHADRRQVAGRIVARRRDVGEPPYDLCVGLALLKSRSRFETFLEKAVELGVREVVPLITARTERPNLKDARARNIVLAGMKQTGRCRLVTVRTPQAFAEALAEDDAAVRLLCHEEAPPDRSVAAALKRAPQARRLKILVGPEGGFTPDEVDAARRAGYEVASLGRRRLRAETAAITAAASVMLAREGGGSPSPPNAEDDAAS